MKFSYEEMIAAAGQLSLQLCVQQSKKYLPKSDTSWTWDEWMKAEHQSQWAFAMPKVLKAAAERKEKAVEFTRAELDEVTRGMQHGHRMAVHRSYVYLDAGPSFTREQWLDAGAKAGRQLSLTEVLREAAKMRKKEPMTENDLRRALDGIDGIAGMRLGPTPSVLAAAVLQYLKDNPEEFIPNGVYKAGDNQFWQRAEDNSGWYKFGNATLYSDGFPLRPLKLQ